MKVALSFFSRFQRKTLTQEVPWFDVVRNFTAKRLSPKEATMSLPDNKNDFAENPKLSRGILESGLKPFWRKNRSPKKKRWLSCFLRYNSDPL
jgi:hypothetical protein